MIGEQKTQSQKQGGLGCIKMTQNYSPGDQKETVGKKQKGKVGFWKPDKEKNVTLLLESQIAMCIHVKEQITWLKLMALNFCKNISQGLPYFSVCKTILFL